MDSLLNKKREKNMKKLWIKKIIIIIGIFLFMRPILSGTYAKATDFIQINITHELNDDKTKAAIHIIAEAIEGYEIAGIQINDNSRHNDAETTVTVHQNGEYRITVFYQKKIQEISTDNESEEKQEELSEVFTTTIDDIQENLESTTQIHSSTSSSSKESSSLASTTNADINIDSNSFPDNEFRTYIRSTSYGADSILTSSEINRVTVMNIPRDKNIHSLVGIEYFTELKSLFCSFQKIETLDISQNKKLIQLECNSNNLISLDTTNNLALERLYVSKNPNLSSLNLSFNENLTTLHFEKCNFNSINLSNNPKLYELRFAENSIKSINLSNNKLLEQLELSNNLLTSLDVSHCSKLKRLDCRDNKLETLKLGSNLSLDTLFCSNNNLSTLDISNNINITQFWCDRNKLTYIDLSKNTKLKTYVLLGTQYPDYIYLNKTDTYNLQTLDSRLTADIIKNNSFPDQKAILTGTTLSNITMGKYFYYKIDYSDINQSMTVAIAFVGINDWKTPLSVENSIAGDDNYTVHADSYFGNDTIEYLYSDSKNGPYTSSKPKTVGTWYVKSLVPKHGFYTGLESQPKSFTINDWIEPITLANWSYGEKANSPQIKAAFGNENIEYLYSQSANGIYTHEIPINAGTWYVKAVIPESQSYKGLESQPIPFQINKATNKWDNQVNQIDWTLGSLRRFKIDSTFGQETATYQFGRDSDGPFNKSMPTHEGIWYMQTHIPGTENYTELETITQINVIKPVIISGHNFKYKLKSFQDISLTCSGLLEDLSDIQIDGTTLHKSHYDLKSGSTILILHSDYLDTLTIGKHTLHFIYGKNDVEVTFEIQNDISITPSENENNSSKNPPNKVKTSDISQSICYFTILSLGSLLLYFCFNKYMIKK